MNTTITKLEKKVSTKQDLLHQRQNAYYREQEVQQYRRNINQLKKDIKNEENILAEATKTITEATASLEKETDSRKKGQFKIAIKKAEGKKEETAARILTYTATLTDLEEQFKVRE